VDVRAGDTAAVKSPLLAMADLSTLVVRCAVPEAHASEVRAGMEARLRLDAMPGGPLPARIARVYPTLDPQMRTRTVEFAPRAESTLTSASENGLSPGMFARVELVLETIEEAVTVPVQAALATPDGKDVVFVLVDGRAARREIEIGFEAGGRLQALSGLAPGDLVLISGQEKLKDGAAVRSPELGAAPGGPRGGRAAGGRRGGGQR